MLKIFKHAFNLFFTELRNNLLAWLDDFALHDSNDYGLLRFLSRFLKICSDYLLVVSLPNSTLFATEIKWCRRIIDENGITMDPQNYEDINNAA